MKIEKLHKIYMIGIKGVGMTMVAEFLKKSYRIEILGSDIKDKFMTDKVLEKNNIKVYTPFNIDNIPNDVDLIIYSTAYNEHSNEELKYALASKIKTVSYSEILSNIFNSKFGISVCGSHGKTTVTAWLGYVLKNCGVEPNVVVGAQVPQFDGNILVGDSNYLIIESDEYQNKLKYYNPRGCLLNNIDYDHPDYFKSKKNYSQVFVDFIKRIPQKGFLVANFDDKIIQKIANVNTQARVISYALDSKDADFVAENIRQEKHKQYFSVKMNGDELGEFAIALFGRHNIYNALAVIATAIELEVKLVQIRENLEKFHGTARRMETMGKYNGAIIIDDYAHHPTEIKTTLKGIQQIYSDKNLICIFHPHTFTRTKALLNYFATSFEKVNELIVLDIYGSAREEHGGVHSKDIIDKIKDYNQEKNIQQIIKYIPNLELVESYLRKKIGAGDLVILMGAGDVFRIGERLVKK